MNSKRWAALGIAALVCILSLGANIYKKHNKEEKEDVGFLDKMLYGTLASDKLVPNYMEVPEVLGSSKQIQLIEVSGVISSESSQNLLGLSKGYDHSLIAEQISKAMSDDNIKALILKVNSPGGSVYESAFLHDALLKLKEEREIPIYVCMESMAASGGYYISCVADKIYAGKETVTGSIGVIMGGLNLAGFYDKFGLEDMTIKSGKMKDVPSASRKMSKEEKEYLQSFVDAAYSRFVDVVAEGRSMEVDKVKELADGRIYDGVQAKAKGLVDELGYFRDALADLRESHDLQDASLVYYDRKAYTALKTWVSSQFKGTSPLKELASLNRPEAYYLYGGIY